MRIKRNSLEHKLLIYLYNQGKPKSYFQIYQDFDSLELTKLFSSLDKCVTSLDKEGVLIKTKSQEGHTVYSISDFGYEEIARLEMPLSQRIKNFILGKRR